MSDSDLEIDSIEMGHLDSELIIMAVKNFPCIYDIHCQEYKDRSLRVEAWESVCRTVVGDLWESFNKKDQRTIGKEIQKKWKNMRDAYRRSVALVQKSESGCAKPKPYVYYKQMSFLRECSEYVNVNDESLEMAGSEASVEPWPNSIAHVQAQQLAIGPWQNIHVKSEPSIMVPWQNTIAQLQSDKLNLSMSRKRKLQDPEEKESIPVVSSGSSQPREKDHDEMFLQSLLPYMKSMNSDEKLDFQIKTLQLIQTYTRQAADQK